MKNPTLSTFEVIHLIRQTTTTKGAERMLLLMLATRCRPTQDYVAWPSYQQLALDAQYDEVTLRRAARLLAEKKLIAIQTRGSRTNLFFLNVDLLQEQAAAEQALQRAEKALRVAKIRSPFDTSSAPATAQDPTPYDDEDDAEQEGDLYAIA